MYSGYQHIGNPVSSDFFHYPKPTVVKQNPTHYNILSTNKYFWHQSVKDKHFSIA